MSGEVFDDFRDVSGWSAIASGEAQLTLSRDDGPGGASLRLDFDFRGGGGFVVARRTLARAMPEAWALSFAVRGAAPANKLEVKLADPSNRNVWWWHRDAFEVPAEWQPLRIRSSEVAFAWGPAGGGSLRELGAIEIAIVAGPGGRGSVWIADLRFEDLSLAAPPRVSASSTAPGHAPAFVRDGDPTTQWRSAPGAIEAWLELDFGQDHEYGGLVVDWAEAAPRVFGVQISDDGRAWTTRWSATQAAGNRSYVYLEGGARSQRLRLLLRERAAGSSEFAIRALDVRPFDFSRSLADFFHAVAAAEPRGWHPRWLHREQSYWTPVGVAGGSFAALLNEEGLFEPGLGTFTIEPFLYEDGALVTWADATPEVSLANGALPIPSSTWRHRDLVLTATAYATSDAAGANACVRLRVANEGNGARRVRLFAALRPFQVTPPWQSFQGLGGPARIASIAWRDGAVVVDGAQRIVPDVAPSGFGAAAFEQGGVLPHLARGDVPPHGSIDDAFGFASAALCWDFELAPGSARDVHLAVPFSERTPLAPVSVAALRDARVASLGEATRHWDRRLGAVAIRLAPPFDACVDALRTATAHVLVCRDGAAIQPGARRYTRAWIRDGATMSAALLRMGCSDEVRDFLAWYAPHQRDDGFVPCAVDRRGPDWLVEHDSHGQLVFTLAEHFRFSGDRDFAAALWPAAKRAIAQIESLRATRQTPEFETAELRARFGLLPESASHEGYLAQPVHAYWDDFWALRGIADASELARALGDAGEAARLAALHTAFAADVYASIATTIEQRSIPYVPGSVEWADFDPTATSTAITTTDAADRLPPAALAWTYDEYLKGLRKRKSGETDWNNYTAYEIRNLGALVRLGRRDAAHELLDFFLADRRPRAWNQWPEISWRDPRSPGHLGDVPHAWIGAEYVLAVLGLFAYERPADGALVIAHGISNAWLDAGEVAIANLPTWWGPLSYSMRRRGDGEIEVTLGAGLRTPPGGIELRPPLRRALRGVEADGESIDGFEPHSVRIARLPQRVVLRF
jgi:hypothetical protein